MRAVAAVIVLSAVVAGCGGSSTSNAGTTSSTDAPTTGTNASPASTVVVNRPASGPALNVARSSAERIAEQACHERVRVVYCKQGSGWTCTTWFAAAGAEATFHLNRALVICGA
jgi:hypothetical protein